MKQIKLLLLLMLVTLQAYSNEQIETSKEKKAIQNNILMKKPSFNLQISCQNTIFELTLNGATVYEYTMLYPVSFEHNINDFITTGNNKLEILMLNRGKNLAKCEVKLVVREFDNFESEEKILTLAYDYSAKNPLENSTPKGHYDSSAGFKATPNGDVFVGEAKVEPFENMPLYPLAGVNASLEFSLETPFPRWKFLDGEKILNKPYYALTLKEAQFLQKNDPKLKKLYELNHKIYLAAKAKDLDKLMSFFKTRTKELAIATHSTEDDIESTTRRAFEKAMNNSKDALIEISEEDWTKHKRTFVVEKGNNLAYLKAILSWNSIKGDSSGHSFNMKFQYVNGEWILVR